MVQGLYPRLGRAAHRSPGQQSGLRVIVLFTDGASNSVPGIYEPGHPRRRAAFEPSTSRQRADPDSQTHDIPPINGLYDTTEHAGDPRYPGSRRQLPA